MNTGLRPIRSASMPNSGWVTSATTLATTTSHSVIVGVQADLLAVGDGQVAEHRGDGGDERAEDHAEDVAPVVAQQRLQRHPGDGAGGLGLVELRGLVQRAADEVGDHDDDGAEPERNPPAPAVAWSSSGSATNGIITSEARIRPPWVPVSVQEVKNARRWSGACSRVSELAPACSPAAEKPCSSRHSTSSAGREPSRRRRRWAGSRSANVETPISTSVNISTLRRPIRSPKWPSDERADRAGRRRRRRTWRTTCTSAAVVVAVGEEDLREDQRGGGAEEEEVVVLDGAAHEAGQRGLLRRPRRRDRRRAVGSGWCR